MSLEPIPSQREPFVDRSRYITSTWWPWFKRLLDTVRVNTAAVTTVTATIDPALSGAVVSGTWGDGTAASCTTDGSGQCSVSTNVKTKTSSLTFTVSGVSLPGYTYVTGVTSVTVSKP